MIKLSGINHFGRFPENNILATITNKNNNNEKITIFSWVIIYRKLSAQNWQVRLRGVAVQPNENRGKRNWRRCQYL